MANRFLIFLLPVILLSQNIDMYLSLLHEGQTEGVKEQLPELISKYPNDPGVMYLQALMTTDGMRSLGIYSEIMEKFPESKYAPDAAVKIGEYFYARGLYSQAGRHLCKIPRNYPMYPDVQRILDLTVSSFRAIGEEDSVKYYVSIYQNMFPNLVASDYGIQTKSKVKTPLYLKPTKREVEPYVVQIGAFGNVGNANRLKLQVSQIGYAVDVVPIEVNGRNLHAVRVVRYKSKTVAEKVGKEIKRKLGIDYRVLYRPK